MREAILEFGFGCCCSLPFPPALPPSRPCSLPCSIQSRSSRLRKPLSSFLLGPSAQWCTWTHSGSVQPQQSCHNCLCTSMSRPPVLNTAQPLAPSLTFGIAPAIVGRNCNLHTSELDPREKAALLSGFGCQAPHSDPACGPFLQNPLKGTDGRGQVAVNWLTLPIRLVKTGDLGVFLEGFSSFLSSPTSLLISSRVALTSILAV